MILSMIRYIQFSIKMEYNFNFYFIDIVKSVSLKKKKN